MVTVWYATREDIAAGLDVKPPARMYAAIDDAAAAGTEAVDRLCHRALTPWYGTRRFDWPDPDGTVPWRLWFDRYTLISLAGLTVDNGDTVANVANVRLYPDYGPPYTRLETDLGTSTVLSAGSTTQQAIAVAGLWGDTDDQAPAGALAAGVLDTTGTTVTVTDSGKVGVGSLVTAGAERMTVTGKAWLSIGVASAGALTQSTTDATITASTTISAPIAGETILVDAERMLVVDVAGAAVVVRRAVDGTTLASHTPGAAIWAPRSLTVTRGAQGSTAATHSNGTAITAWVPPSLAHQLAAAEATNMLLQRSSGWARTVGTEGAEREPGRGIAALRDQVRAAHGRKMRIGAV